MLKTAFSAALFLTASAAIAQPARTPPPANAPAAPHQQVAPPPAFMQAAQAFGECVEGASSRLPLTVTPEAAAAQALAACAAQKTAVETQFEAWVVSDTFPAEGRDIARTQFRSQFAQAEGQIANAIRQQRAAAATPAPAPTPSN